MKMLRTMMVACVGLMATQAFAWFDTSHKITNNTTSDATITFSKGEKKPEIVKVPATKTKKISIDGVLGIEVKFDTSPGIDDSVGEQDRAKYAGAEQARVLDDKTIMYYYPSEPLNGDYDVTLAQKTGLIINKK